MQIIILIIIYIAFIGLGTQAALLGVAWPAIRVDYDMPLDAVGMISLTLIAFVSLSVFFNNRLIRRFGHEKILIMGFTFICIAFTGYRLSTSFFQLVLFTPILGFGVGSIDVSGNKYVATHYESQHMNWLHSFWGFGSTIGPVIMGTAIGYSSWRLGYKIISIVAAMVVVLLMASLRFWKKARQVEDVEIANELKTEKDMEIQNDSYSKESYSKESHKDKAYEVSDRFILKKKGVIVSLLTFLLYVAGEMSVGLWGSSYLVQVRNIEIETAASWIAFYYGGITLGRFLGGFISMKLGNIYMIRLGCALAFLGALLILLPLNNILLRMGFGLVGMGFAPMMPSLLHETPRRFGKHNTGVIMSYQMFAAYMGGATIPPLLGVIGRHVSLSIFPWVIISIVFLFFIFAEIFVIQTNDNKKTAEAIIS